jgi:hypothetical protein
MKKSAHKAKPPSAPAKDLVVAESPEVRAQRLMDESVKLRGNISIRLNAQLQDPGRSLYVGLPGQSISFKATTPEMVERAFDAIEAALRRL